MAYHLDWIRQRSNGREWLDKHAGWGSIPVEFDARPNLPWMLKLLGERPIEKRRLTAAWAKGSQDLSEYHKRVAQMSALFPECQITDLDAADRFERRVGPPPSAYVEQELRFQSNFSDIAWQFAFWGTLAIAALRLIRRLKSRRHTEPPVG